MSSATNASITTNGTEEKPAPTPILLTKKPSRDPTTSAALASDEVSGEKSGEKSGGPKKTACVRTFGCQMNVHDSDRMRRMVQDAGYAEVERYEDADLVVLNTCYVRENAVDRVKGHLGELNR